MPRSLQLWSSTCIISNSWKSRASQATQQWGLPWPQVGAIISWNQDCPHKPSIRTSLDLPGQTSLERTTNKNVASSRLPRLPAKPDTQLCKSWYLLLLLVCIEPQHFCQPLKDKSQNSVFALPEWPCWSKRLSCLSESYFLAWHLGMGGQAQSVGTFKLPTLAPKLQ